MSYCKRLDIADVDKFSEKQLNDYLDMCEDNCPRYTTCDTVAHMNDRLKAMHLFANEAEDVNRVIPLNIDIDDWDKYLGSFANDYRDIWVNKSDLDEPYNYMKVSELLETTDEFKRAKRILLDGRADYIALRADID